MKFINIYPCLIIGVLLYISFDAVGVIVIIIVAAAIVCGCVGLAVVSVCVIWDVCLSIAMSEYWLLLYS
jgi:hypothetical protein